MRKFLLSVILIGLAVCLPQVAAAQCNSSTGNNAGTIVPTAVFQTSGCLLPGDYLVFNGVAGTGYTFTMCSNGGSGSYDSQLTVTDNTGAPAGGYNDDFCGLQSEVSWSCSVTGTYRIYLTRFGCSSATAACATIAYNSYLPPAGSVCATAIPVPTLPFSRTAQTTCGFGDDYSSADVCGDFYMNGDDIVYSYTSAGNEVIDIALSNTAAYTGVFVTLGCPSDPTSTCIPSGGSSAAPCAVAAAATNTSSGGNPFGTFTLTNAGTYYITISTWPSPQCTDFDIAITPGTTSTGSQVGLGCYSVTSIPYTPVPYNTGTTVVFPDDRFSSVLPIGFDFCFMGTQYSNFLISSNGYITFDPGCSGEFSEYSVEALPTTAETSILLSAMVTWQDIDPSVGGEIRYTTLGTAPNRRLVVNFNQIPYFSCNTDIYTGQLILYETSNIIEFNVQDKPVCAGWGGGRAVQGIHDYSGTVAVTTPGRNNTVFTLSNDAQRYSPTCTPCNTILTVNYLDFSGANTAAGNELNWTTHTEDATEAFVLEHSLNGEQFYEVSRHDALGTEDGPQTYHSLDRTPFFPRSYYRLREIGQDGNVTYSEVIEIQNQYSASPLRNVYVGETMLNVELELARNEVVSLELVDATGRLLHKEKVTLEAGNHDWRLDMQGMARGVYCIRTTNGAGIHGTRKFVY